MLIFAFEEMRKQHVGMSSFSFSDIAIQYPQFFGHSYVTFEPLKNSYQAFQITLEFRVRGMITFCLFTQQHATSKWQGGGREQAGDRAKGD